MVEKTKPIIIIIIIITLIIMIVIRFIIIIANIIIIIFKKLQTLHEHLFCMMQLQMARLVLTNKW